MMLFLIKFDVAIFDLDSKSLAVLNRDYLAAKLNRGPVGRPHFWHGYPRAEWTINRRGERLNWAKNEPSPSPSFRASWRG